jgi:hypothetical protein
LEQPWWESRDKLALSISEAAQVCGVRRRTIRKRHQAGEFEHAFKDPDGSWKIPVNDLIASGLRPNVVADPDEPRIVFTAASQVDRLRMEVAVLRERVRALEVIARERGERVNDLRTILRMLPAHSEPEESPIATAEEEPPPDPEPPAPAEEEPVPFTQDVIAVAEEEGHDAVSEEVPAEVESSEVASAGVESSEVEWAEATLAEPSVEAQQTPAPVRVMSQLDPSEPVIILPDAPANVPEPSEGALDRSAEMLESARQRSTELLDDALSMWWPSGGTRTQSEERSSPWASSPSDEPPVHDDPIQTERAWAQASRAVNPAPHSPPEVDPVPSPPPIPQTSEKSDLFTQAAADESSLDWLDPDFERPPTHVRRRLGRLFRRNRRPR